MTETAAQINNRVFEYNKDHCWQYDIRIGNLEDDLARSELSQEEASKLQITDFKFGYVDKTNLTECKKIVDFIERHEWLGKMPLHPTHRFTAYYKDKLAGVIVMAMPNAFTYLLGKENRPLEKLISRGACISWSPKNLASALMMYSIKWMVDNTKYRLFTAYSDPEARELGTIYQACNFYYLGQTSGTMKMYSDPKDPNGRWFSDRTFRSRSSYKRYAKEIGVEWKPEWQSRESIKWELIPEEIIKAIKERSKKHQQECVCRVVPSKHKYAYILGRNKKETYELRKLFTTLNPDKANLPYPKERGK